MFTKALVASAICGLAASAPADAKVDYLPEMGYFDKFDMYSGYLETAGTNNQLFYLFTGSYRDPTNDPLIIWFNGGPGCSSLGGFLTEIGPFVIEEGETTIHQNQWTWNAEANLLFIDSPAGVGYSYCDELNGGCDTDDDRTAQQALEAILNWFELFPEYKQNELFLAGESYAGIYVPYLTNAIDEYNTIYADSGRFLPNLRGFMVGNGVTNWEYDCTGAFIEMAYWHSLYDTTLYNQLQEQNCQFVGPYYENLTPECEQLAEQFFSYVDDLDAYDIFTVCYGASDAYPQLKSGRFDDHFADEPKKSYTAEDYTPWIKNRKFANASHRRLQETPLQKCDWGYPLYDYFNRYDVRQALHVPDSIQSWEMCTDNVDYTMNTKGSQWVYEKLKGKYKMLHYSGDVDGVVPTLGTYNWIQSMGWDVLHEWQPWMVQGQVGGYVEVYDGDLTFATVHGAGHMVPQYKRQESLYLASKWVQAVRGEFLF